MKHIIVYKEEGRYAGWPANYGMWSWGNEIVLGFTSGYHLFEGGQFHAHDKTKPFTTMQARSLDGGESWISQPIPAPTPGNRGLSADEHIRPASGEGNLQDANKPAPLRDEIRFTDPDFAMMLARNGLTDGASSWFYTSTDRCNSWHGPYSIPMMGQLGIAARTDYQISGIQECLLFLTAPTIPGTEYGSRVFCARTVDGGKSFAFVSWIGPELTESSFNIMPSSVRLSETRILTATRDRRIIQDPEREDWIDLYSSDDNGATWNYAGRPVEDTGDGGNPPSMIRLKDGRLCLTYGYRNAPYGIRAKLSMDEGQTWGEEIVLRSDGGSHDIGYPRSVQRPDGTVVTAYYYNDQHGGACYIAATLWKP